ncbi:MAG: 50S ribosomal protein L7/L12 [Patescibacteria group bacterium]
MTHDEIIAQVEKMTVMELNTLVKAIEEKWGVSATAVAAAGPAAGPAEEASSEVNVKLAGAGEQKIAVIKVVREALALGLADAKKLVDEAPTMLKENMKREDAEALKKKIEEAGGKVEFA